MDKIKKLIKNIIKASDKFRNDIGVEEQLDEVKVLANELDYTVSNYKKPKIYKYKCRWILPSEIAYEWRVMKDLLERKGYRIEVVKIKKSLLGNSKIYYRFIEE